MQGKAKKMSEIDAREWASLYSRPLPAKRTGSLYGAFPYPTKISAEAIALYIATHTSPGDTVFDGFAGSGTTGLAALLCENPPDQLCKEAGKLRLPVKWGARNAVLYEIGKLGAFIGQTLTNPPDPVIFLKAARRMLCDAESLYGWAYRALDPDGNGGVIRYAVWSDKLLCPVCCCINTLWDGCVSMEPARINSVYTCPNCSREFPLDETSRVMERRHDEVTGRNIVQRLRQIVRIYGITGNRTWSRPPTNQDFTLLKQIADEPLPNSLPNVVIPWGDLYRRGYHKGITHLHHFYTRRNLAVFARLWERTDEYGEAVRDALRFWLLSYNASHATIMTRVVAKSNQKDLVVTSAQPGVLYVSGLPVEKNLFAGLRRKLTTISRAFAAVHGRKGRVDVFQDSCCRIDLPDNSIDYVFTDPPFGGNIPYAEINFLNEAWLGEYTDRGQEIIISPSQKKSLSDYQQLLTNALCELRRVLKHDGKATLVFHSASANVWNALQSAYGDAGFCVECAGILDKKQGSFKQVTTAGAVRGDPVLLLGKNSRIQAEHSSESVRDVVQRLQVEALSLSDPLEQTPERLYSRLVGHFLTAHQQIPLDASKFYSRFSEPR